MPVRVFSATPLFLVSNIERSAQWYRDVLGFCYDGMWGNPPRFAMVERDGVEIMLSQDDAIGPRPNHLEDASYHWDVYIRVSDVERFRDQLAQQNVRVLTDPTVKPYKMKEFEIQDPDGYVICFAQDVSSAASTSATELLLASM
jgi:catechol 2,3-dioxygenase-like lactoylglutathione lyase family enzyme